MKNLLVLFLMLISFSIQSQVYVGDRDYLGEKTKPTKTKDIEKIKGSKILFVLPDIYSKEEYNKILKETWNFSDYELVPIKDFKENPSKYLKVNTVVAQYNALLKTINYTNPNKIIKQNEYVFIDITFYIIDEIKVGKKETKYGKNIFGQISFCPDYGKCRKDGISSYLDISPNYLRNYNLGYLKNYLTIMNKNLVSNSLYDGYAEIKNIAQLRQLKTQKLYIVEDVKQKNIGVFNRDDRDLKELTADYEYKKEFITAEELSSKILMGEEIFYLFYNQDNSKKIISVVNSKTAEVIYNVLDRMSFSVNEKDFKVLNKAISKS